MKKITRTIAVTNVALTYLCAFKKNKYGKYSVRITIEDAAEKQKFLDECTNFKNEVESYYHVPFKEFSVNPDNFSFTASNVRAPQVVDENEQAILQFDPILENSIGTAVITLYPVMSGSQNIICIGLEGIQILKERWSDIISKCE